MSDTSKSAISEIGVDTPVGPLTLRERDGALIAVSWGKPAAEQETPLLLAAKAQLDGYFFCKLERFELALAPEGSEFDRQVWDAMLAIPYGRTLTYGEIAAKIGGNARDVGGACGRNPIPIIIPCHRVMGANGTLIGYSGGQGVETKQALLALEGVLLPL
jgi:methylated-DNA-[protein]-cysteine S-methyltransferase